MNEKNLGSPTHGAQLFIFMSITLSFIKKFRSLGIGTKPLVIWITQSPLSPFLINSLIKWGQRIVFHLEKNIFFSFSNNYASVCSTQYLCIRCAKIRNIKWRRWHIQFLNEIKLWLNYLGSQEYHLKSKNIPHFNDIPESRT